MRTRSRRAPLLAACAFALAVPLSAPAGDTQPVAAAPVVQPTMPAVSGTLSTPEGKRMAAELAGLEQALIKHLKGEQPSTFAALDARRKELKARIDGAALAPADRKVLDERLGRTASVITRSLRLTGGASGFDAEMSKAVVSAGAVPSASSARDPLFEIDSMLGDLEKASANPASAERIFDNLNRRYGSVAGPSGAVRVNFGAIREKLEVTYTPDGAPGTNAAKARNLARATPAPVQEPEVARGESVDYAAMLSLSAGRAANAISERLPDGAERRFNAERADRLKELLDAGRRAVSAMGGDPDTFPTLDALVAHLSRQEQDLSDSMGLGDDFESMDEVMRRVAAIKSVNRELGAFMANLWEYRQFLRVMLVGAQVPLDTRFVPWETFPDGQGTSGAQVVGLSRGVSQFVGLRYDNPDGSSRFQGQSRDGRSGLIVVLDKAKRRTESFIGYTADGKVNSALTEMYDGAKLTHRERLNMATGLVEIVDFKADGTELKSTRRNTKTGEQFVRDLAGDENRFEATTRNGVREIRFLAGKDGVPPAVSLRVEHVDTDGNFVLDKLVLQNGTHIVARSAHVNQLLENGKKNLGWEVALKSLVDATDARKRLEIGRRLAQETIAALGMNDDKGRLSKPMGAFLAAEVKDTGDLIDPSKGAPIRFFINENKNYLLIFTRRDGTRRILSGTFTPATEFDDDRSLGTAFGVSGEIEIDAAGNARQTDPKIVFEYLYDGSRLTWLPPSPVKYTPKTNLGWLGKHEMWWTNEHEKTEFKVRRDLPPDPARAEWNPDGKTWISTKDTIDREIQGTSVFGTGARWAASVPGVKQVLGVCGDVASTLYTGIVSGGQMIAYEVTGIDDYRLEATAGYSRNPGVKLLMGGLEPDREKDPKAWRAWKDKMNKEYLARVGSGNIGTLDAQAKERREKALAEQGITMRRAPQAYRDAMNAPVSEDERYDALSDFGAGTYGRRLAENGHEFWGAAMSFTESFSEGMLNPLMYVIPGIGRLAGAAGKVGLAATSPTVQVVAKVAEFGLRGFQYALLTSVVGSFTLSALDNIGKVADYWGTPEASVKAGEAMADLAFGGMMIHGFAKERTRDRLAELKKLGEDGAPAEVKAEATQAAVNAVQENLGARAEPVQAKSAPATPEVKVEVKAEAKTAPAVDAAPAKAPGMMARMNSLASTFWSELKRGGDAFSEKSRDELRSSEVKPATRAEANGPSGAALDAKSAEIKTAEVKGPEVKSVEVKAAEVVAPEAKGSAAKTGVEVKGADAKVDVKALDAKVDLKAEVKAEVKADVKADVKAVDVKAELKAADAKVDLKSMDAKTDLKSAKGEGRSRAKAETRAEAKGEIKDETAKIEEFKNDKRARAKFREEGRSSRAEVREEVRTELREEVRQSAAADVAVKEKVGRFSRAAQWLGEKGRALGERAERGSRWLEKRPTMRLARGTVPLPITPAMKRNMLVPDAGRNRGRSDDPPPPEKKENETVEEPAPVAPAPEKPAADEAPQDAPQGPPQDAPQDAPSVSNERRDAPGGSVAAPAAPAGAGGGGSGGGPGEGGHKSPKAPKFGGFGDGGGGGGGGGGGPAGNGADGGGGGGGSDGGHSPVRGPQPQPSGPAVSPVPPPNLLGGGPVIPVNRGPKALPNDTAARGGHEPAPSLASRFDGSRPKSAAAPGWSPTPMKGMGAGDSPALPRITPRAAPLAAPAAAPEAAPLAERSAGGAVAPARSAAPAPGVKPEEEDFSYTYMPPARHKYELPTDRPAEKDDWRSLLSLGLRGAAALAIAYLVYHSDLPYLVGLTRRRRDGTYGA